MLKDIAFQVKNNAKTNIIDINMLIMFKLILFSKSKLV